MNVEPLQFNLNNKDHCYLLGFFWADCYYGADAKNKYRFSFEIKTEDFVFVKEMIKNLGIDKFSERTRTLSDGRASNSLSSAKMYGKDKLSFFEKYKFNNKYFGCPIYWEIPNKNKGFFIKGFLDGDGCVSLSKENEIRLQFSGKHSQDWSFLDEFCNFHNIDYKITNKSRKASHESHIKDTNEVSLLEIYKNKSKIKFLSLMVEFNLGVKRKIEVFEGFLKTDMVSTRRTVKKKDLCACGEQKDCRSKKCRKCSYIK